MPRHQQVTTCRKGGPVEKFCNCENCSLSVCSVCGAYEDGLTTDCPGLKVAFNRQKEVYETSLDYTDERGWHLGAPMKRRTPRFESTKLLPELPRVDPRTVIAPSIYWAAVDRHVSLQHELAQKAIAWALAESTAEDHYRRDHREDQPARTERAYARATRQARTREAGIPSREPACRDV